MARRFRKLADLGTVVTVPAWGAGTNQLRVRNHGDGNVAITVKLTGSGVDPDTDFSDSDDGDTLVLPRNGDAIEYAALGAGTWDVRLALLDGSFGAVEILEF